MGQRQKAWARISRQKLVTALGKKCSCGCGSRRKLELDCVIPQGHAHHRMEMSQRLCFYWRQYRAGNLQLLSKSCHLKKTLHETYAK